MKYKIKINIMNDKLIIYITIVSKIEKCNFKIE